MLFALLVLLVIPQEQQVELPARLVEIVDHDRSGKVIGKRTEIVVNDDGLRIANAVRDGSGTVIARETFKYDKQGRMVERENREADGGVNWKWTRFAHNADGEPISCSIVDGRGRVIGTNRWKYDDQKRFSRRERFNRDGTLRFAYDKIEFDADGQFTKWVKFDGRNRQIGDKLWKYGVAEKPDRRAETAANE